MTLLELMVVIAIIPLVAAILLSHLGSVFSLQRQVTCQNHLHKIGQAYATRTVDRKAGKTTPFTVTQWMGALLPYLGEDEGVLICPEADGTIRPPISQQLQLRFYGRGWDYDAKLAGPYVAKMSNAQYYQLRSAGYLRHGRNLLTCPLYPGYVEDRKPNVVWFCIEELQPGSEHLQPGNPSHDYEDIRMRVTDHLNGTVSLYFELGSGQLDAQIVRLPSGKALVTIPRGHPRSARSAGPFPGGLSSKCSYGMNSADLPAGLRKVHVLDYEWVIAQSSDRWAEPKLDPDRDGVPVFARHRRRINVLFLDGSVETKWPQEIDPILPSVARRLWDRDE